MDSTTTTSSSATATDVDIEQLEYSVSCILCDEVFQVPEYQMRRRHAALEQIRSHLVLEHKFVITDIHQVPEFPEYFQYWKQRLQSLTDWKQVLCLMQTNTGPNDCEPVAEYWILDPDSLPEEKDLRQRLTLKRLDKVLPVHAHEMKDQKFERMCLFCRKVLIGSRSLFLSHLEEEHNFTVGAAENVVFLNQLLDVIDAHLKRLVCLFCNKQFSEWDVLREHMRKKGHKHLDPENRDFDPYFLINYLESGRTFRSPDPISVSWEKEEAEVSDWTDDRQQSLVCLFCRREDQEFASLAHHMDLDHGFKWEERLKDMDFYQRIKFLNFTRKKVKDRTCFSCDQTFEQESELMAHLKQQDCPSLSHDKWQDDGFLIPVLDDDLLLSLIPCDDEDETVRGSGDGKEGEVRVIGEQIRKIDFNDLPLEVQELIQEKGH